ncbi:MAG: adenosylcobinamide-GDP ribazoletransferase [Alphaproteobacteria bacterium]
MALATSFLTVLPTPPADAGSPKLAGAAYAFPVVGALLGTLAAVVYATLTGAGLPGPLAAGCAIVALIGMTGGLHEDGLADSADAMGAGGDRTRAFVIMRDSRLGSYGGLALICSVGLRWAALASLPLGLAPAALIAAPVASRWLLVHLMRVPPARTDGLGHGAGMPDTRATLIALLLAWAIVLLALPLGPAVAALVAAMLAAGGVAWLARRRLGGQTGDVLGAGCQVAETVFLLALAAAIS